MINPTQHPCCTPKNAEAATLEVSEASYTEGHEVKASWKSQGQNPPVRSSIHAAGPAFLGCIKGKRQAYQLLMPVKTAPTARMPMICSSFWLSSFSAS